MSMNGRELMKNTPNWVLAICATVGFITVVAAFVFLSTHNADSSSVQNFVNTVLNLAGVLFGGGAFIAAGAAAKSAAKAEEQTNGVLKPTMKSAVKEALIEHENGGGTNGGQAV